MSAAKKGMNRKVNDIRITMVLWQVCYLSETL